MKHLILCLLITTLALPFTAFAENELQITRAEFCTSLDGREPGDSPEAISAGQQTVYFFTEILNGNGQAIAHRWYYNDFQIANVALFVGADRWRTWSTKQVWHLTPGTLKVEVVDFDENVLVEKEIVIQ